LGKRVSQACWLVYSEHMISKEEVQNLAQLARLELGDEEVTSLQKDMSNILEYVGQISQFTASPEGSLPENRNILRPDEARVSDDPMAGKREAILQAFPKHEGDHLLVRKIIQKDE